MGYIDQANLAADPDFQRRLGAAAAQEAKPKPEDDNFANAILRSPEAGSQMFMPFVAAEPGFDSAFVDGGQEGVTDGQILSALQANWDRVSEIYYPTPVVP